MTDLGPAPTANNLLARTKAIILSPKTEWPRIDAEMSSVADIYKSHVIPLAAIGPVANLIGSLTFGHSLFGITYRPSVATALSTAVFSYAFTLIGVYLLAVVIDLLAPQFGAPSNRTQAFKVAAYSGTAAWVAGIFGIVPAIAVLGILGLYSIYLMYLGLPILMKVPQDKAMGYTAVVIVATLAITLILGALTAPLVGLFASGSSNEIATASGTLNVPGAGSVDLGKLGEASKKMEAAANGKGAPAIASDILQGLLPAALPGGLTRTSVESSSAGAAGIGGSTAEARYGSGENEIRLTLTDMGALGGLAALGGAINVQSSKQDATSYEKIGKVDGRMTTEKYDSADKSGTYGVIIGDRVMVEAQGNAASIDAFKAAVGSVDAGKIESLVKP